MLSRFASGGPFPTFTVLPSIVAFKFVLFSFNKSHEFLYISYWIKLSFIIFLATWTIHKVMLLTSEIFYNSFDIRRQTPLWSIKFKMLYLLRKFTELLWSKFNILSRWSISHFLQFDHLVLFFHLYQLLLMSSQLIFEDFINYFKARYFI